MIRMVNLTCPKCGMSLDCDAANMQTHCPNCSGKLLITVSQVMDILDEKKEIKRKGVVYEKDVTIRQTEKKPKPKHDWGWIIVSFSVIVILTMLVLMGVFLKYTLVY